MFLGSYNEAKGYIHPLHNNLLILMKKYYCMEFSYIKTL